MTANARKIAPEQVFKSVKTSLRLLSMNDCTARYVAWLADPEVNQYLETRWAPQALLDIENFVSAMLISDHSYLFAILDNQDDVHVGNIKVGPIQIKHQHADVSYFIGDRTRWGKGLASDAIATATRIAFAELDLHRVQAGVYENNIGSCRALEKAGYTREGVFRKQLRGREGWEDHIWYGRLREEL